ncbi:hypothetical protein [Parasedimentitalea maritima]|uniref:hypothetical protein n=1 Tax=Parasedimentitalea maritima TaxID=2578117 RepID=UPI001FD86B38|nr:hypothetical protein [Zongyanglinia marina]
MQDTAVNVPNTNPMGSSSNDYHLLPVTEKQTQFALAIAKRTGKTLPSDVQQDRHALSVWISENKDTPKGGKFENYASSKQVAFAERIARMKRRTVPDECIRDRSLMSKWIDYNR